MTTDEIKTNEIIAEAIDKLIEKYQKKADKERAKVKSAYITYKGEKYYSEKELEDAYCKVCCSRRDKGAEQMKEMYFEFGAFSDKFSEQCERQGYRLKNAEKWDELVHCTVMLYIHNILTESRYNECLDRILKFYKDDLEEI